MIRDRRFRLAAFNLVSLVFMAVRVCAATLNPSMEDLSLSADSYWNGSDLSGGFHSEWVHFGNSYDTNWASWCGFSYSSVNDTNAAGWDNQYAVWTPGVGVGGSGTYAIAYDDAWNEADIITFPFPACVKGFYVNNSTYAALTVRDGDAFSKKFGGASGDDPDWFKLTITGKDRDGASVGDIDFYLADYQFTNNTLDYIVSNWTWVDLTSLGPDVKTLRFTLSSSDVGAWGMNTPAYFAIDNLSFIYSFSGPAEDTNLYDPAVPGFVGPDGDGNPSGSNNYMNLAFSGWANSVIDYSPAPGVATEWTNALKTLGPATGDNMDIASLGDLNQDQIISNVAPGSITLSFDTPISDESGPDFAVFENGFSSGSGVYGELGYIEVSSDGTNYIRFPAVSLTTNAVGAFEAISAANVYNLCGKHINNGESWGTPFDLSDLVCHAKVQDGTVNLSAISRVKIVDIPGSGSFYDAFSPSNAIYDPWQTIGSGGVDLEAVGVINSPDHARITIEMNGPGCITPYGLPGPAVSIPHGSNMTFSIAADAGHHLLDVLVNGVSLGITNSYTFTNVLIDQAIKAVFGNILLVRSSHSVGTPAIGTNYDYGTMTASISGSPVTNAGAQYVCAGWTGSGSVPASGTTTNTGTFSLTNDSIVTWLWTTNYWLDIESTAGGKVDTEDSWIASGQSITSTASADPYYAFTGWGGDTQGDTNDVIMVVSMDGVRSLTASFWADLATNDVPKAWLTAYGLTNNTPDEEAQDDQDGDLQYAWQEFFAGTDPNNPTSVFQIIHSGCENGSNYVVWLGGTNGSALPFSVLGCSNLLSEWSVLDGNVERSPSGTNTWWSTNTEQQIFYRIKVDTGK